MIGKMANRVSPAAIFLFILCTFAPVRPCFCAASAQAESRSDFAPFLEKLAGAPPDPCGAEDRGGYSGAESGFFDHASDGIIEALNATPADSLPPAARAKRALEKVVQVSAQINRSWPEENRFQFEILDIRPILVVKMTLRTHARFYVFGVPEKVSEKSNGPWVRVGSDSDIDSSGRDAPRSDIDLYVLHRGPSGAPRFLARLEFSGCAGSSGIAYDAREWNTEGAGQLKTLIKQGGAIGFDSAAEFPLVGSLQTNGPVIALPYCWFSPIDTWDNPSMCAVDAYDLTGDNVVFQSRVYNRPDLLPIAKAIEYAEERDYQAVLAYCASAVVARRLVREMPPYFFAGTLQVTRVTASKERVELGDDPAYRFEVEKQKGRWLVTTVSRE